MYIEILFTQFCWAFQSPWFTSKITFCNTYKSFESNVAVLTTPFINQHYERATMQEMLLQKKDNSITPHFILKVRFEGITSTKKLIVTGLA